MTGLLPVGWCRKRPPYDDTSRLLPECCGLPVNHRDDCRDEITGRTWSRDEARLPLDEETR